MLLQTQMHCGVVLRSVIVVCLMGFTAAKCDPEKCGSMNVSYPFWINNPDCGYPGFKIECVNDFPFFTNVEANSIDEETLNGHYYKIMEIGYEGQLIINSASIKAYSCHANLSGSNNFDLTSDGPFTISMSNKFVVVGCNGFGTYTYEHGLLGEARCRAGCFAQRDPPYCRYGCCEISLPDNSMSINFTGGGIFVVLNSTTECAFSTIMDPSTLSFVDNNTNIFWGKGKRASYGLRLHWGISLQNCLTAKVTANYSCSSNAICLDSPSGRGHVCKCLPGFEGSGYSNGTDCTVINNECSRNRSICVGAEKGGICHNLPSSYNCSCAKGYMGDGFPNGTGCISTRSSSNRLVLTATIGSVSSFVVVSLAAILLVCWLKKRHLKLAEAKYFQLLQQYIASTVGREGLRIFSGKELARASNNYSNEMLLGSGGFGTVFKGILLDGTLVAIKKSKQALNVQDDHEFLNEVTILSQINHRNIVKLLGCCIQTKFPLLVSEFVPNGTLFEHLHSKEGCLPWASRLQIAIETGEALTYLHSGASQPIFHRDIKSSNILLNERLSPKVADFGISRLISASNNTHVTTNNIKGTWGYLDPEYFQTFQLTEKSDVYSFGVVLVELLTALKPLSEEREEMSLSRLFLSKLNNNRLTEILDSKVSEEENLQQMEDMARIARECLHLERKKRPSMKEVVEELVWVRGGTRKTKFHDSVKCSDAAIIEETNFPRETSQPPYKFRSYTFPFAIESRLEEGLTALIEMSTLTE